MIRSCIPACFAGALMFAYFLSCGLAKAEPILPEDRHSAAMRALATPQQRECLAVAIYHEARGESERGQMMVGRVILNRVASRYYPNSICAVVYQNAHLRNRCQFSFACSGRSVRVLERKAWRGIQVRADLLIDCLRDNDCQESQARNSVWISTHYHADYVHPFWADKILRVGQIGRHIFYYTRTM